VLDRLLRGHTEKQISAALRLSPHTVHQYVKLIYKRLGVHSRGQLLARWVRPSTASQEMGPTAQADTGAT
jgi:DNA-binding CsgD family transcriptional regulator